MAGANPMPECDQPLLRVQPACPVENSFIFDPEARTITHWSEGPRASHGAVVIRLSDTQVEQAKQLTSISIEADNTDATAADTNTTTLGPAVVEGTIATGIRITTMPVRYSATVTSHPRIHEVWRSEQLGLVLRIVDGDPQADEIVSGLEHLRLDVNASLFQPPAGYSMEYRGESDLAKQDMEELSDWFVK